MKTTVILSSILAVLALLTSFRTNAQNTCVNAVSMPIYQFAGQQMGPSFSTVGVANDNNTAGAPFCVTSLGTGGQRWFKLNLPNTSPISVSITTNNPLTNFDTKLHVYTGSCGALTCVTANDDGGVGTTSLVTFTAQPGVEYLIRVGGYMAAEGTTAINMTAGGGSPGCTEPSASNYSPNAAWDDGSCCISGLMSLSADVANSVTGYLFVDGEEVASVISGQTVGFCVPASCDYELRLYSYSPVISAQGTYTVIIDNFTNSGTVPPFVIELNTIELLGSSCGCMDPNASNYSPSASIDSGVCTYQQNWNCSNAQLIEPGFSAIVNSSGIPVSGLTTGCAAINPLSTVLWYKFVYHGGTIQINSGGQSVDTVLGVFWDCGGQVAVACADDVLVGNQWTSGASHTFSCGSGLVFGETYYIAVGLFYGTGAFSFSLELIEDYSCCDEVGTMSLSTMDGSLFFYADSNPIAVVNGGSETTFCIPSSCNYFVSYIPNAPAGNCQPTVGTYEITFGDVTTSGVIFSSCQFQNQTLPSPYCGCTDPNALNYVPSATVSSGDCTYPSNSDCNSAQLIEPGFSQMVNTTGIISMANNTMCQNVAIGDKRLWYKFVYEGGIIEISTGNGFIDTVLGVFDECDGTVIACVDDVYSDSNGVTLSASQTFDCNSGLVHGQTYYIAIGYADGQGSFAFSLNSIPVSGCTSPCSSNYNPCASVDDGSCAPVPGCTFACSENYNPCASVDDGSCIYPDIPGGGNPNSCQGDFNGDQTVNFADLVTFLTIYGTNCAE